MYDAQTRSFLIWDFARPLLCIQCLALSDLLLSIVRYIHTGYIHVAVSIDFDNISAYLRIYMLTYLVSPITYLPEI